jgi:PII-like signaling protein
VGATEQLPLITGIVDEMSTLASIFTNLDLMFFNQISYFVAPI